MTKLAPLVAIALLSFMGASAAKAGPGSKPAPTAAAAPSRVSSVSPAEVAGSAEEWKGAPEPHLFDVGAIAGLGIFRGQAGFALMGTAAYKVGPQGFIPDVNDAIFVEIEAGPLFVKGSTAFQYSTHLRWDFIKDETWTFYSIGGVGGQVLSQSGESVFDLYPRIGLGAIYKAFVGVNFRAEVSHELIAGGVSFAL